ncbi:hypothetical protein FN846DRAFT_968629 [Sphaerosporella brunnea]|uniref:Uncharacterized protein n=1 Tax=Sphaerosporella brunnea TaxID=1250544 RepID=A0A5J5EKC4_9PEZI|nr:hypothetical protein FN846DRAFT_968629 [Sphaerosporella brunnea]
MKATEESTPTATPTSSSFELPTYPNTIAHAPPGLNPEPSEPESPPAFTQYEPTTRTLRYGKVVAHDEHLNNDGEALYQFIMAIGPPLLLMHLRGLHLVPNSSKPEYHTVTDFSFYLDLSALLAPGRLSAISPDQKRYRGSRFEHLGGPVEDAPSVRDWCHDYVGSSAPWKKFNLHKRVLGLKKDTLRACAYRWIRATGYEGNIEISFTAERRYSCGF